MKLNLYIHYHPISTGPICLICNPQCTVDTVFFESNKNSLFKVLNEKLHWNQWMQVKEDLGGSYIYDRYMIEDYDMNYTYSEKENKCKSVLNLWQSRIQIQEELHIIARKITHNS
jgi:hypothetical protein